MLYTEYETTVVLRPDLNGDQIESTLDRLRNRVSNNGLMLALNHWGKKRLAYEVNKYNRGIYVHAQYLGAGSLVSELERNLRLSENVLRFLTVKTAEQVSADSREAQEYVRPEYDAPGVFDDTEEGAGAEAEAEAEAEAAGAEATGEARDTKEEVVETGGKSEGASDFGGEGGSAS